LVPYTHAYIHTQLPECQDIEAFDPVGWRGRAEERVDSLVDEWALANSNMHVSDNGRRSVTYADEVRVRGSGGG
jgi:hypothetical protein